MAKRTRHENLYILLSLSVYGAIIAAYFLLPAAWQWYIKLPALLAVAAVYEVVLRFIVKKFK